jgi:Leucine-rich repeat (LRR) protein
MAKIYSYLLFILLLTSSLSAFSQEIKNKRYTSLAEALKEPDKVYELMLNEVKDKKLPSSIKKLINLKILRLVNSPDLNFSDAFTTIATLSKLEELYLHGNTFTSLPKEIVKIKSLKLIHLNASLGQDLPEALKTLAQLPALECLKLNFFNLKSLPTEILLLKKLNRLSLFSNPGLNWNTAFRILALNKNITALDLGGNDLKKLPEGILLLENLQELSLYSNEKDLNQPQTFITLSKLKKLNSLNIEGNMWKLPKEVELLKTLKTFYINGNCIVEESFEELKLLLPDTKIYNDIPC